MSSDICAMILAAGFGTRLKPWTLECAKPLIPVSGVEALFYALYKLHNLGITKIFVNSHYKADQIEQAIVQFRTLFPTLHIKVSFEKEILGSGGGILKVIHENQFASGLLALNGDTLSSIDSKKLLDDKSSTFAVSSSEFFLKKYSPLYIDSKNKWSHIEASKTGKAVHFLGAYFLHPDDIALLRTKKWNEKEGNLFSDVFDVLKSAGRSPSAVEFLENGMNEKEFWFDLTSKEFLLEARQKLAGPYFSHWEKVLSCRHPGKEPREALNFWPLSAQTDN
jgi:NDP-sugar pyrophosphorylase family protein